MQLTIDTLIEGIENCKNPTCVGLDTQLAHLPEGFAGEVKNFEDAANALVRYNRAIVDALAGVVPSAKVHRSWYRRQQCQSRPNAAFPDTPLQTRACP